MFEILNEPLLWLMIVLTVFTGVAVRYWSNPLTEMVQEKLKSSDEQIAKLQKLSESLALTVHDLETRLQKQFDAVESKVTHLTGDVGNVIRETHDLDKHVGTLEVKADAAASKVDTIMHHVDVEVGELKRIDDQVKDSLGKVKTNAHHIQYLEDEVRSLVRELHVAPIRTRRDRHIE
jgi:chromosome segregation ATPase